MFIFYEWSVIIQIASYYWYFGTPACIEHPGYCTDRLITQVQIKAIQYLFIEVEYICNKVFVFIEWEMFVFISG